MGLSNLIGGVTGKVGSALTSGGKMGVKLGLAGAAGAAAAVAYMSSDKKSFANKSSKDGDKSGDSSAASGGDQAAGMTFISYPLDLGQNHHPHYVNFYINVNTRSKLYTNSKEQKSPKDAKSPREADNTIAENKKKDEMFTDRTYQNNSAKAGVGVGKLVGAGGAVADFLTSYKRLKTAVSLPLPAEITSTYSAEYGNVSTGGIMGSFLNSIADGKGIINAGVQAAKDIVQYAPGSVAKTAAVTAGAAVGSLGGKTGAKMGAELGGSMVDPAKVNAIFNKARGQAMNERLEQTFKQMNFRQFAFNYVLAPRDEQEFQNIQKIIKIFKNHMHPELGDQAFLIMPDEFDIEFRFQSGTNDYLHKIKTCALTNVSVNYTPVGNYVSFQNGGPVMVMLQLNFIEMYPLTREDIEAGA